MALAFTLPRTTTDPATPASAQPRFDALLRSARQEVVLIRSRPPQPDELRHEADALTELLRRWVRVHVVWDERLLADPAVEEFVRWQRRTRAEVRTGAAVPATIALVDCRTALISPRSGRARVCRCPETATMMHYLVQGVWDAAAPMAVDSGAAADPGQDVLRLLAGGLTDQQIARRLGVSERTVARTVARSMTELGARSRFEAGVRAARLGLLPAADREAGLRDPCTMSARPGRAQCEDPLARAELGNSPSGSVPGANAAAQRRVPCVSEA